MNNIRRLILAVTLTLTCWIVVGSIALASSYSFSFPITVKDTSNVTRTNVPVLLGFGGQSLVDAGYIVNGLDTNMQAGTSNRSYMMDTSNVLAVIPNLGAGGQEILTLYTGYIPAQTTFPIVVGVGGYVTTNDTAGLEWGASGNWSGSFYVDTSNTAPSLPIGYKTGAVSVNVSSAGSITAKLASSGSSSQTLLTNGAGDATGIDGVFGAATHWQAVQTDDGDTSYVIENIGNTATDYYAVQDGTIPTNSVINSVTVYITVRASNPGGTINATPLIRLNGVTVSAPAAHTPLNAYITYSDSLSRPGGGAWQATDIPDIQIGVTLAGTAYGALMTQEYVIVNYSVPEAVATVNGVSSGVHSIGVALTQPGGQSDFRLYVDSSSANYTDPYGLLALSNNANNWVWMSNATPYASYIQLSVGVNEMLRYQPATMVQGTTLVDTHSTKNGDITWGTNSNIAITYGAMTSSQVSVATQNATQGFTAISVPLPTGWFAHGENLTGLPFYNVVADLSNTSGIPAQTFYFIVVVGIALSLALFVMVFSRSALVGVLVLIVVLFYGVAQSIVPMWMPFSLLIIELGIMYLYRQITY